MLTNNIRNLDREKWWDIHEKDKYICPDCKRSQSEHGFDWEVHHINGQGGKVVGLCRVCHNVRHGANRKEIDLEYWKQSFLSI